ncbi:MAG: DUF349 domain-containing protein [Myxococcales bacterium]|nr:DUF349 domain-containing protein [Myxococcales bacterium]
MGIADFFRPKYRHSDVRVRAEAVRALTSDDAAILEQIARTDRDIGVRRIAIEKIETPDVLADLGAAETERSLRQLIAERAAELWVSRACSKDAEEAGNALSGIIKLGDQHALVEVTIRAATAAIRKRAFGEVRDPRALAELAKSEAPQDIKTAAIERIDDGDVLRALAIDTTQKEVGLAAVEKLDDVDRLENVAQKAKNKAVRQKARKIVTEIQAAEKAKQKSTVPDDVKRRRAEKAQLLREMEALADTYDFAKHEEAVARAEVQFAKLAADDGDEKFGKAVERFWKRKELHESQARSADELRATAAEAQREKERAAAERRERERAEEEKQTVRAEESPEAKAAREAREAEAAARRAEREAKRAEEDARRAAQAAERELRAKEDAEKSAQIAASLEAMCTEMEGLLGQEAKDIRPIDRLLAQASKGFEAIGKVQGAARDAIASRYHAARGKLVIKAQELREAEDWQRWTNVPKAEALIDTAKQMAAGDAAPDLGNRLRQLQLMWKEEVGALPQKRGKDLWDSFKAACDQVYEKVKGVRAEEDVKFAAVTQVKEALIAEAEAVADSTDFAATAAKLKDLQARWKDSGHLPRKQGDELWKRFRAACDRFFERRKPVLEERAREEAQNLAAKQQLIARAQSVANAAGEGTWGKAIGEIKDLQAKWKEIGHVPRRDADALWKAFRAACDSLFAKRDQARDSEANAHRAQVDAIKAEIDGVIAGGDDIVKRAIEARAKARELGVLGAESVAMVKHLIANHADAIKGTELDPAQLRAKREKLIAKAEELLPKQAPAPVAGGDVAAQLKAAMQKNAFGDLRFSGRDPVEVVDELRTSWAEIGPILEEADRVQVQQFEQVVARVLDAAGAKPRAPEEQGGGERRERRRRGDRAAAHPPMSNEPAAIAEIVATAAAIPQASELTAVPDAKADAVSAITPEESTQHGAIPMSAHDAITQPAHLPPEVPVATAMPGDIPPVVATPLPPPPARAKALSVAPPTDAMDDGWDMGDEDPTASKDEGGGKDEGVPSSTEMAGDGSVEGDGLDQVD